MKELIKTVYFKWGLTLAASLTSVAVILYVLLKAQTIHGVLGAIIGILAPFLYGIVIAYILRPVYNGCMNLVTKNMKKMGVESAKMIRIVSSIVSIVVSLGLLIAVVAGIFVMVIPQLVSSIYEIITNTPTYGSHFLEWVQGLPFVNDTVKQLATEKAESFFGNFDTWTSKTALPYLKTLAVKLSAGIVGMISMLFDIFVGVIVCVYILIGKKKFASQGKKIVFSVFEPDNANTVINGMRYVDRVFTGYVSGNLIDAVIIAFITFIVMSLFNWPYALLISVLVGLTNLIPFFGPFIGAIPSTLLIITENPIAALYFVIFIIILQQIDGNVIKPKIFSEAVSIPSFWTLFAILVGGGMFGIVGLLLGVPVFTLIYTFIKWLVNRRLEAKDMPIDTAIYNNVKNYDEEKSELEFYPEGYFDELKREKKQVKRQRRKSILERKIELFPSKRKADDGTAVPEDNKDKEENSDPE